jgi:hypothetical protein
VTGFDVDYRRRRGILVRDLDMRPLFVIDFYGIDVELSSIVFSKGVSAYGEAGMSGGDYVAAALRRRGIDPESVFFTIWDVEV